MTWGPHKSIGHNMYWEDQYPIKNKQLEMADHHGNVNWCYNVIDQNNQKSIHQEKLKGGLKDQICYKNNTLSKIPLSVTKNV